MSGFTRTIGQRLLSTMLWRGRPDLKRQAADILERSAEEIAYGRLVERGFKPGGIIDVGAFEGSWTRLAHRLFGPTPMLMVEAQPGKAAVLERVVSELPACHFASAALSERSGETLTFFEMGTGSSLLPEQSNAARTVRTVVTRTLDEVVAEALPDEKSLFLKIDVQGAELKVLGGGTATLARCELVQLELALLNYNEGAPLFPEVVGYMAERGFLPIEVSGYSRPRDVLVQIDLLFARQGSRLRPNHFTF